MISSVFLDIGYVIIIATVIAFLARKFNQPLIPAYIIAGLIIGPLFQFACRNEAFIHFFHLPGGIMLISDPGFIWTLSEIGVAFLLFVVGLEIDIKKLRDIGAISTIGGIFQVGATFAVGFLVAKLLFFSGIESFYIGIIVAFSSTMVVVKMLSDRRELDTLHGRIILGILLMQDFLAILAIISLNMLGDFSFMSIYQIGLIGVILVLFSVFLSKVLFPSVFKFAARSRELLFLAALSICFFFSIVFQKLGFSIAIGAFVAGITVGNLPYNFEIIARIKSLRDFFATLFFVSLGMQLVLDDFVKMLIPFAVLFIIVILVKPLFIMIISSLFGYKKRTSFLTSISLAQISEFSLIIVSQGMLLGQVSSEMFTLTILLALASIAASSYFIKFDYSIYRAISGKLNIFDRIGINNKDLEKIPKKVSSDTILCGYNRTGYDIGQSLIKMKKKFFVIDFNPEVIKRLQKKKIPCIYGDVSNPEILEILDFRSIRFIISTVPDEETSLILIKKAKRINKDINIILTAYYVDDALRLYEEGADYVILPHFLGGYHASILLEEATLDITKLFRRKDTHIRELNLRKELGHEHPANMHHDPKGH